MNKKSPKTTNPGFTIIEVTLALAFLSVLLLTITFLTIHITSIYQKGLSMKAVTSTGRELVDEFSRSISSASGVDAKSFCDGFEKQEVITKCKEDNGRSFVYQSSYARPEDLGLTLRRDNATSIPVSGVFCSGHYSYIWNSGYVLNKSNTDKARSYAAILKNGDTEYRDFRLLKVVDVNRSLCSAHLPSGSGQYLHDNYTATTGNRVYDAPNISSIEEILTNSEDNLALYSLDIFEPTTHDISRHSFYSGTFILATIQGGIDITSQGDFCSDAASLDLNTDFNYCAINKFNFAIRATGGNRS